MCTNIYTLVAETSILILAPPAHQKRKPFKYTFTLQSYGFRGHLVPCAGDHGKGMGGLQGFGSLWQATSLHVDPQRPFL